MVCSSRSLPRAAHDIERGHDHAWRAEAALQAVVLAESLLHRMQRAIRFGQALDGGDLGALTLQRERGAGLGRDAVDMNDASAALRGVAADMRAGQPQILAQELHQQGARFDVAGDGFAVHRHGHGRHDLPPNLGPKALFSPPSTRTVAVRLRNRADFRPIAPWNMNKSEPRLWARSRDSKGENRFKLPRSPHHGVATVEAKFWKKSSAIFFAAPLTRRWPSWASLPPICASTL